MATEEFFVNGNGEKVVRVEWHDIIAWKKLAVTIERLVQKGDLIYVEGKIRNKQWTDGQGVKRYSYEIEIFEFQRLSRKSDGQNNEPNVDKSTGEVTEQPQSNSDVEPTDDLPF